MSCNHMNDNIEQINSKYSHILMKFNTKSNNENI